MIIPLLPKSSTQTNSTLSGLITPGDMPKERVVELVEVVRQLQPNTMPCSRVGHGMGDYASKGDMEVPPRNIASLWETCDTNNDSWSYACYDNKFKSPKEILCRLITTVARGGTYLFNIGPDGKGRVPEIGAQFLRQAGQWIQKYPQVVYGAGPLPWGDITTRDQSLYLSIFSWPQDNKLYLPGLASQIISVQWLGEDQSGDISFDHEHGWTLLHLPAQKTDTPIAVIEMQLAEKAQIAEETLGIYPNITSELLADFAGITEAECEKISWIEKFGEWKHVNQISPWPEEGRAQWSVDVFTPGYYYLDLRYKGQGKLVWHMATDEGMPVQNQQGSTGKYQTYPMGIIEFKMAGKHTIEVSLVEGDRLTASLESMLIRPIQ
jgi:alpha-L-fucosidase